MRTGKYIRVAERLSQRIRSGDYHIQGLPAERELAEEVGVSHMTARKAIQKLLDEGLLQRLPNGRLEVCRDTDSKGFTRMQVALLAPAWESQDVTRWHVAMVQLGERFNCSFRLVYYAHWDDPIIRSSVERFDATFFVPIPEPMPASFPAMIRESRRAVVVLGDDWSGQGVPSLRLYPPVFVQKLLDHLASLGHTRIGYFNVQPVDPIMSDRLGQWKIWLAARGFSGPLINQPVPPYTETLPAAYQVMARLLDAGTLDCTALLCTTERVAAGAMRAMVDRGLTPGKDIAVCTVDSAGRAEYSIPTLTTLEPPDPKPYLAACLEWMLEGSRQPWHGPLLMQPADALLAVRQSTVPEIEKQVCSLRQQLVSPRNGQPAA